MTAERDGKSRQTGQPDLLASLPAERPPASQPAPGIDPAAIEELLTGVLSVLAVSDGAVIGLFDGFSVPIRTRPGRVSDGRRRVKPLRGSFASLRPFG